MIAHESSRFVDRMHRMHNYQSVWWIACDNNESVVNRSYRLVFYNMNGFYSITSVCIVVSHFVSTNRLDIYWHSIHLSLLTFFAFHKSLKHWTEQNFLFGARTMNEMYLQKKAIEQLGEFTSPFQWTWAWHESRCTHTLYTVQCNAHTRKYLGNTFMNQQ